MAGEETLNGSFKIRFLLILVIKILKKTVTDFCRIIGLLFWHDFKHPLWQQAIHNLKWIKRGAPQLPRGNQVFALKFSSFSAFPSYGYVKAEEIYSHSRGKRGVVGVVLGEQCFLRRSQTSLCMELAELGKTLDHENTLKEQWISAPSLHTATLCLFFHLFFIGLNLNPNSHDSLWSPGRPHTLTILWPQSSSTARNNGYVGSFVHQNHSLGLETKNSTSLATWDRN